MLDQYRFGREHSIAIPDFCLFDNIEDKISKLTDLKQKIKCIQASIEHYLIDQSLLNKIEWSLDFSKDQKALMKSIEAMYKEYHQVLFSQQQNKLGDLEFIQQFTQTQIFASFFDDFIESKRQERGINNNLIS